MNPGDLVTPANGISRSLTPVNFSKIGWRREDFVTGRSDDDDVYAFGGSEVTFEFNDVGIVLLVKKLVIGKHTKSYIKILTSQGIGWIFENSLEVVK